MVFSLRPAVVAALAFSGVAQAAFSLETDDDIKQTAKVLAGDLLEYYHGDEPGQTPGILPGPPPAGDYYWWEAGAMWGTLIDYWHLTGDDTYNDIVTQAMLFQVGPNKAYMPPNVTASLGNDDQGFWGLSAMLAAENGFPDPPKEEPQWLALAQAVFHTQASPDRHDETCGGGLRWQIPITNVGYNYKNSIANGCFFNLGARLARYTHNETYAAWADETWDWMVSVKYIDEFYNVFDGGHVEYNCTDVNRAQFSYNAAIFLQGAAYMYNYTNGSEIWKDRAQQLANATIRVFFSDGAAHEVACEDHHTCTVDMFSFKGYVHRWLSTSTQVAPFLAETLLPILRNSTEAAVAQCTGGVNQRACGFDWRSRIFDGRVGAGQTMNVLGAVSSLLIGRAKAPVTNVTGGTSVGDYDAGSNAPRLDGHFDPPTAADKAGAAIVTVILLSAVMGTFSWMSFGE